MHATPCYVFPCFKSFYSQIKVRSHRCGNDDGIDFQTLKHLLNIIRSPNYRIQAFNIFTPLGGKLNGCGDTISLLIGNEISKIVRSPVADTDLSDLQHIDFFSLSFNSFLEWMATSKIHLSVLLYSMSNHMAKKRD
jgi:hypothetical protein